MSIYMLNLVFDASDTTAALNGRFKEYEPSQTDPLLQSKAWLMQDASVPGGWSVKQEDTGDGILLQPNCVIQVRVVGLTTTSSWRALVTTVVARSTKRSKDFINPTTSKPFQQHASPFPYPGNADQSNTIFVSDPTNQPLGTDGSFWEAARWEHLHHTTPNPPPAPPTAPYHDSYNVIVSVTATLPASGTSASADVDLLA